MSEVAEEDTVEKLDVQDFERAFVRLLIAGLLPLGSWTGMQAEETGA